ncbi:nucleotidyltransferase family protein [Luedemannella flava]|uniref:nucleotidyltransferase family protein n=1 Tax=Luedemannella flava TaxID=349316 RepID=UPI003CD06C8F
MTPSALILCGGEGRRMGALNPKALIPVGPRALIIQLIGHLINNGVVDICLCLGHYSDAILDCLAKNGWLRQKGTNYYRQQRHLGAVGRSPRLHISNAGVNATAAQRLLVARKLVQPPTIVCYGDTLADISIKKLILRHQNSSADATVTVARSRSPYGHVTISDRNIVTAFREKPMLGSPVNLGFILLGSDALDRLTPEGLETSLLPQLATERRLAAYEHKGSLVRITDPADVVHAEQRWSSGDLSWLPFC